MKKRWKKVDVKVTRLFFQGERVSKPRTSQSINSDSYNYVLTDPRPGPSFLFISRGVVLVILEERIKSRSGQHEEDLKSNRHDVPERRHKVRRDLSSVPDFLPFLPFKWWLRYHGTTRTTLNEMHQKCIDEVRKKDPKYQHNSPYLTHVTRMRESRPWFDTPKGFK